MHSLEKLSPSRNEVAASAADASGRLRAEAVTPLTLVRQASPAPAPHSAEPLEAGHAGSDLGDWLSAASHVGPCGVVICNSPEQAMALVLLATRGAAAPEALSHPHGERSLLTLLFTDIVGSTGAVQRLGDEAWQALLLEHHAIVRARLANFGGREVDHAGDGFFATFDQPSRAVRCAEAIRTALAAIGIVVRAGVHAGECQTIAGQVTGVAVHVAARICSLAQPGEVLVSASLRDLVAGSDLEFADRQWHSLKGLNGTRQLFALSRPAAAAEPQAAQRLCVAPPRTPAGLRAARRRIREDAALPGPARSVSGLLPPAPACGASA